jgi:hypothetical protein
MHKIANRKDSPSSVDRCAQSAIEIQKIPQNDDGRLLKNRFQINGRSLKEIPHVL